MSDTTAHELHAEQPTTGRVDRAQFLVCALFAAIGTFLIVDASRLGNAYAKVDPLGPKFVPIVIGSAMLACAAVFAVAILRGSTGIAEEGEDIDLSEPSDWRTVALLVSVFGVTIVVINPLDWPLTATFLFTASTIILGVTFHDDIASTRHSAAVQAPTPGTQGAPEGTN